MILMLHLFTLLLTFEWIFSQIFELGEGSAGVQVCVKIFYFWTFI